LKNKASYNEENQQKHLVCRQKNITIPTKHWGWGLTLNSTN